MKLRPYQYDTVHNLREEIKSGHRRIILCAPTGAGKTVMFSDIVHRAALRGTITLILTDRIELFEQSLRAVGESAQKLSAKTKTTEFDHTSTVTVAMVETFKRRDLPEYKPQLIICDEAHKATFNRVMDKYPDAMVIGATATPEGRHLHKYYNSIVSSIDIPELVDAGFLSPCVAYQMQDDFSDLKANRTEYTDESLFHHFDTRKLYEGLIDKWTQKARTKKTLVFNVNIEHTKNTNEAFLNIGVRSAMLTSGTPKAERIAILEEFHRGDIQVLNNCGILTTGYDEPSIECIVVNRKTKSLPLWLQMCGRGSRIHPGKKEFIVLDFGQNHDEHGLWNEPRNWALKPPKKKKQAAAPVKECPMCDAMVYASARQCFVCGYEFPEKEQDESVDGVLVEVTGKTPEVLVGRKISQLTIDELIKLQKSKRYKAAFIWRVIRHRSREDREQYRDSMGYSSGWAWRENTKTPQTFQDYTLK